MSAAGSSGRALTLAFVVALLAAFPAHVDAQCAFDSPARAKGFKSDLVRAYSACPGVTFAAPNTSTMAGVPGCAPPAPLSEFSFDDTRGRCSIRWTQKAEEPCSTGTGVGCAVEAISVKCGAIADAGGAPIESGTWSLEVLRRVTLEDAGAGDMTVIDFPTQFAFEPPRRGKIRLDFDFGDCAGPLPCGEFGPGSEPPACSHREIVSLAVVDPTGAVFAKLGSSSR